MNDDWLSIEAPTPQLPAVVTIPTTYAERVTLVESCWSRLSLKQRAFLTAWRENRFNARRTARRMGVDRSGHKMWLHEADYGTVARLWQGIASEGALDKDRLLLRQDDIVETLLTPRPILHQGADTGFREIQGSAAARANETLMKAAGLLKDKELEINVGAYGPALMIQVVQADGTVAEAAIQSVPVKLPEPAIEAEWTDV